MKNKILFCLSIVLILLLAVSAVSCSKPAEKSPAVTVQKLPAPQNLKALRRVVTWDAVENATGYIVNFENTEYETSECQFELYFYDDPGTYKLEVKAVGKEQSYYDSDWAEISVTLNEKVVHGYDELGFEYTLLEDGTGYEVSKGKADLKGVITIPDYFGDYPVKRIADDAFVDRPESSVGMIFNDPFKGTYCNKVTTGINLPACLESIGQKAFAYMVKLEEIVIPDTVKEIEYAAFSGCTGLTRAILPKGLKSIPNCCFENTKLSEIILPETLESIGTKAFYNRYGNKAYDVTDSGLELTYIEHVYSSLSSIVIPKSVKYIGGSAFAGRESLETVTIMSPENIEFSVDIFDETLWYSSLPDGPIYFGTVLYGYKGMTKDFVFEIPDNITAISSSALAEQKNLKKVIIPSSVKYIGSMVFYNCTSLSEVILPEGIEEIPSSMFNGAESLKAIELPNTVTKIGLSAFSSSGIEKITIPSGVKIIEGKAFAYCSALTEIVLPEGLESIGYSAFMSCKALETLVLPNSLEKLEGYCFYASTSLKYVCFKGSYSEFKALTIDWTVSERQQLSLLKVYYYSEAKPTETGDFWHYVDGKPTPWAEES